MHVQTDPIQGSSKFLDGGIDLILQVAGKLIIHRA
jgi:hypothetical protein